MTGTPAPPTSLEWRCQRLFQLQAPAWHRIMRARQQVFIVEQACIFLDADDADEQAWHLVAWAPDGEPAAYARLVDPGVRYLEPSIGRVLTTASVRGSGVGRELVARAIDHCLRLHPGLSIRISAQLQLQHFYTTLGFQVVGEPYLEDEMPHIGMLRPAGGPSAAGLIVRDQR